MVTLFLVQLFFFNYLFVFLNFWLCWVLVAVHGLSLVAASGGYSLLRSTGSRRAGFSSCGTWAQQLWLAGSRAQAQQLWLTGLVAPRHVGSSRTRARTRVPCIDRRILNHCATREVPIFSFLRNLRTGFHSGCANYIPTSSVRGGGATYSNAHHHF